MKLTFALLTLAACARPPADTGEQRGGLELHRVTIEAWRGNQQTLHGTAPRMSLKRNTFEAREADLTLASGTRVAAPLLAGDSDGSHAAASQGGTAQSAEGCRAATKSPSRYDGQTVHVDGPVSFDGCGVALTAQGMRYGVAQHKAELDGPVETRVEAQR